MGRPLAGPVRIGKSLTWFARLTVRPADRPKAGTNRLCRSLGTTDHTVALERWPSAYKALQDELSERLQLPIRDHHLIRARIDAGLGATAWTGDGVDLTPKERTEQVLRVSELDPDDALHAQVFDAISNQTNVVDWLDLVENHSKHKLRKTGKALSAASLRKYKAAARDMQLLCPYPVDMTKDLIKRFMATEEDKGKDPAYVSHRLAMANAIFETGIKSDLLACEVNPFRLVDFIAVTNKADARRGFNVKTELPLLLSLKYGEIFRLMCATSLRIGELTSREPDDIDGNMLVIKQNPVTGWEPKTKSSYRRIPLDDRAVDALHIMFNLKIARRTFMDKVRAELRNNFEDKTLTIHSTRHTFKTLTRVVGMPSTVSDSISGHAKAQVSQTSDSYGEYPTSY